MTLRIKCIGADQLDKMVSRGNGVILAIWHGNTMIPIYYLKNRGIIAIVSESRDGQLQGRLLASRGYRLIRGSSSRGGVKVLITSARMLKNGGTLAITPDGPRGPNREMQAGTVQLASKTGSTVLPIGVACQWGKRVRSWDKHLIPFPFSKAVIYFGEPIIIDENLKSIDEWTLIVQDAINAADEAAAKVLVGKSV
jgi:lysophospholipid acyltransferase (LPLAT)-like uncharacterized protein